MNYGVHDLLGNIGVALILGAYLLVQLGRLDPRGLTGSLINAAGAALVVASLAVDFNLSAFVVESGKDLPAFELADEAPRVGRMVYLFARLRSEAEPRLIPAVLTQVEANWLLYAFKDKNIDLAGTSGAPVLDERGRVVGMNVGGGEEEGQITGVANPAARMKELIAPPRKGS
jgi:hypothetical protein